MIPFRHHLDDASLAEVADLARPDGLRAAERLHLDSCDRCRRLVTGHERAARLLSASWRLVPVADLAASGLTVTHPGVRLGLAFRMDLEPTRARWLRLAIVLGAALLLILTALLAGSSPRPLPTSTRITFSAETEGGFISVNTDGSGAEWIGKGSDEQTVEALSWSPDGTQLALTGFGGLVIVAAASPEQARVLDAIHPAVGEAGAGFEWSPDGSLLAGWVWFRNEAGNIEHGLVIVEAESGARRLTVPVQSPSGSWLDSYISWSPDGSRILYVQQGATCIPYQDDDGRGCGFTEQELVVLDVATSVNAVRYRGDPLGRLAISNGAWSPDGSRFVFYAARSSGDGAFVDDRIMIMDQDAIEPRELTVGRNPTWSPDGAYIAFEAPYEGANNEETTIWVIRPDSSGLRLVGDGGVRPRWSPDGQQIAYCGHEHGQDVTESRMGYFVADVAGGSPRLIYRFGCYYYGVPVWQPTPPGS